MPSIVNGSQKRIEPYPEKLYIGGHKTDTTRMTTTMTMTTYDQTCITYAKDKCETYISPRPVPPKGFTEDKYGVITAYFVEYRETAPLHWRRELTRYSWYPRGLVVRYNKDGTVTEWVPKPTYQEMLNNELQEYNFFRLYGDGSIAARRNMYREDVDPETLNVFWGEDREVERPSDDHWITREDMLMGNDHPDLFPEGWYCRDCCTARCTHVAREKTKLANTQYEDVC